MVDFRVRLTGLMPTDERWISFYEKNQVFVTLCQNCIILKEIKNFLEGAKGTTFAKPGSGLAAFMSAYKDEEGNPKRQVKEIIKVDTNEPLKKILLHLLMTARSRLLHRNDER